MRGDEPPQEVKIWIAPECAYFVKERCWHPTAKTATPERRRLWDRLHSDEMPGLEKVEDRQCKMTW